MHVIKTAADAPKATLFEGEDPFRSALRGRDWSTTALGDPDAWPALLRTTYALMLDSHFPMILAWGRELSFLYNAAYAPILYTRHPAALGAPMCEVWPEYWNVVQPVVVRSLLGETTYTEDVVRRIEHDGVTEERSFNTSYSPVRDADGTVAGVICVISEHTARLRLEQRQAFQLQVADRLRELSDPQAIFSATIELLGRYLKVSRVVIGEYDCEQGQVTFSSNFTDGTVAELSGSFDCAVFGRDNFALLETGASWIAADTAKDPCSAGALVWPAFQSLQIHAGVLVPRTRNGNLISCLFINHSEVRPWREDEVQLIKDVADRMWNAIERVRAEAALVQADRRKDQFLALLAHELRNPLAPISAAAELLKLPHVDSARAHATGTIIARQVSHMTGLVDDLLDVSRVTRGLVEIDRQEIDIKRVVADAIEQVRPLMDTRRHHLAVQLAPGDTYVGGDYQRLVQVLANLCNNAAKYTPQGGRIEVTMDSADGEVIIRVSDDGVGISSELLPHVFELFSQAERNTDRAQGGLGLGLALVRSLVDLHGGSVTAASEGLDKGSTFTVRLPRIAKTPAVENDRQPGAARAPGACLKLLVVDDNVDGAQMLAMYLEASGHDVAVAHTGPAALQQVAGASFDACLLDIGLPGMDGNELARRLRTERNTRAALLIAVTGYGQQTDGHASERPHFDHYLVKPVDPMAIVNLLSTHSNARVN
ncbi:MAG: ATP-binding protein [Pseudomonadota bacterium]